MSKIKIKTLTAVHIGSGKSLQYGTDFVRGDIDGYDCIGIVDPHKVMDIIGENNISEWVIDIENKKSTSEIIKKYSPSLKTIDSYSKRIIDIDDSVKNIDNSDSLKEFIHDGQGNPYIPGSSIKGAIRTALFASSQINEYNIINRIEDNRHKISAKNIEADIFGKDPYSDILRFLQVGDAIFGDNYEVAIRMVNINDRKGQSAWDTSKPQLIEAIGPGDSSSFNMKLNTSYYALAKSKVHNLPECMTSITEMFKMINAHTKSLLSSEVSYCEKLLNKNNCDKVEKYLNDINVLINYIDTCDDNSCILRIGHGSGWRFITGAWTEHLNCFTSKIIPSSRPKNYNYSEYEFPKTRRVNTSGEMLGFIKLTLV